MSDPHGQQPGSVLDIRPTFFPLAFLLFFFKPSYSINGSPPIQGQWKQNFVPVPPGRYQVTVWVKYLFFSQMGISSVVVDVPPASAAVVTWRAPYTVFSAGKIAIAGVGPAAGAGGQQQPQFQQPQAQQPQAQQPQLQQPQARQPQAQQPQAQQPQVQQPQAQQGGWHPDPTGRHQVRYFDGAKWTEHVSDGSTQSQDPLAS